MAHLPAGTSVSSDRAAVFLGLVRRAFQGSNVFSDSWCMNKCYVFMWQLQLIQCFLSWIPNSLALTPHRKEQERVAFLWPANSNARSAFSTLKVEFPVQMTYSTPQARSSQYGRIFASLTVDRVPSHVHRPPELCSAVCARALVLCCMQGFLLSPPSAR